MQECGILTTKVLSVEAFKQFSSIFESFRVMSFNDYKFESPPLSAEEAEVLIKEEVLKGYLLYEDEIPKGFLLYLVTEQNAIELNIIHLEGKDFVNKKRKTLLNALVEEIKDKDFWNVVSYPLLGIQQSFVREIVQFDFKMVGQTVVKYSFSSILSDKIRKKFMLQELPEGYEATEWKPEYYDQACEVIFESFSKAKDTLFDPRFLTIEGTRDVVNKIVNEDYGVFLKDITTVLLNNGEVVGVCFANLTNPLIMNIPLVGIKDAYKNKGFGKYLLKQTSDKAVAKAKAGELGVFEINATVETDNFPALRMYRKIGYMEDHSYPHAYLNNQLTQIAK